MTVNVGVQVETYDLSNAVARLRIPADTSKSGVIRAALAYMLGRSEREIQNYANPTGENRLTVQTRQVKSDIPDDLAAEAFADNTNKSNVVRIALLMSSGLTREQAEAAAHMQRGRPRKNAA